jgi:hypothetical protein
MARLKADQPDAKASSAAVGVFSNIYVFGFKIGQQTTVFVCAVKAIDGIRLDLYYLVSSEIGGRAATSFFSLLPAP